MIAIALSPEQLASARRVALEIGDAVRAARIAHGETQEYLANAIGAWTTTVASVERGEQHNVKLGTLTKIFNRYGLSLRVTRAGEDQ